MVFLCKCPSYCSYSSIVKPVSIGKSIFENLNNVLGTIFLMTSSYKETKP